MAKTLASKLAAVMAEVKHIPKRGRNKFHGYDYATEADVSDAVRDKLSAQGIAVIPNILPDTVDVRERTTDKGKQEFVLTAVFELMFVDGESGETLTVRTVGQGQDSGDKAGYKATTGAYKYAIMKAFLIPTGDDPERDEGQTKQQKPQSNEKPQNRPQQAAGKATDARAGQSDMAPSDPNYPDGVTMAFGKHKGLTLSEIAEAEAGYIVWLAANAKNDTVRKAANDYLDKHEKGEGEQPGEPAEEQGPGFMSGDDENDIPF